MIEAARMAIFGHSHAHAALPPIEGAGARVEGLSDGRKLAIFLTMSVGQFMAVLDIQIVAASMSSIQAGLSAGLDEIDWLQTAYLMAEIVMIPLSAYLAHALSTRWMFVASAGLFTLASLMCGLAWDLPSMIAFRVVQGFVGGAMIPLVFATGFTFFDGTKAALATAVLGVISTLAPTLGPSIGGWITDTVGWRWLFFINVAPGLLVTLALIALGPIDRAVPSLLKRIDWLHAASLAVFLGGVQFVLEEGPPHQWFQDRTVAAVGWTALVAAAVFFERCFFSRSPLVKLGPLRHKGFAAACVLSFVVGFGLYTSVYLTPVFLAQVRGFTSLDIGSTVFVTGIAMTLAAGPAAWLATRFDQRFVMAAGLLMFAVSSWMMSAIGPDWGFWQLLAPQLVRGVAILFCMVPVVGMSLSGIPDLELRDASGLNSLTRNLGGAVGIALVNTWLIDFFRLHALSIARSLGAAPDTATAAVVGLAQRFGFEGIDPVRAGQAAAMTLGDGVSVQALTLAFDDVFRITAWVFVGCVLVTPFCRAGPMSSNR
jgi:DHA2 family multidrug resistance protein